MKAKILKFFGVAVGLFVVSSSLIAHHGVAPYDMTKVTTLKATVTDFQFINPHTQLYFEVKGDNGKVEQWVAELNSENDLVRQGWNKNMLKPGDEITVSGYRSKNGTTTMRLRSLVLPSGKDVFLLNRGEAAP